MKPIPYSFSHTLSKINTRLFLKYYKKVPILTQFEGRSETKIQATELSKKWIIPTGYLIPLTNKISEKIGSLNRISTVIESNTKERINPHINELIDFVFKIGIEVGLFPNPEDKFPDTNQVEERIVFEKQIKNNIVESYFVQLGLNAIPYGTTDNDSFFCDANFDKKIYQNHKIFEGEKKSNKIRHMKEIVLWIFTLFNFDNLIDDGKVLRSNINLLKRFVSDLPKIIYGATNKEEVLSYIKYEIKKSLKDPMITKECIESEIQQINNVLELAVRLKECGNFEDRFLAQITQKKIRIKFTEKEKMDNYLQCLGISENINKSIKDKRIEIINESELEKFELFIHEAGNYFSSSVKEMSIGINQTSSTDYIDMRRVSGAILTVLGLSEFEDKRLMSLPEYLAQQFEYKNLNKACVDIIWGVNDIGSAKEWYSHEPNYLKIKIVEYLKSFTETFMSATHDLKVVMAFKLALCDLVTHINNQNQEVLRSTKELLEDIDSGYIFNASGINLSLYTKEEQTEIKKLAKKDLTLRLEIRKNLIAAGNVCIQKSTRYFDPDNDKKNINLSKKIPNWTNV